MLHLGARAVLVKGGHFAASDKEAVDVLATAAGIHLIRGPRFVTNNTHGTGCTLSAAIAAHLATGKPMEAAVRAAKAFLGHAIQGATNLHVGAGHGPVDHLYAIKPRVI